MKKYATVEDYISSYDPETREKLELMRKIIKEAAPEAVESISYGMPGYKLNGKQFLYFGGFPTHIGFYPLPCAIREFSHDIKKFKHSKGAIQFSLAEPLPIGLIKRMVKYRISELEDNNSC
ncbi:MAG: DUF1801 domain-containing protein [Patescibacteria group bacterium]